MKLRKEQGFSLTELLVVITIMGVLLSIISINFSSWQKKYGIKGQAEEMLADLSSLRLNAIQSKSNYLAVLSANPKLMTFRQYSANETVSATTGTQTFSKTLKYAISNTPTGVPSCADIQVDQRGYTGAGWQTIYIQPTGSGAGFDCLVMSPGHINLGQYNGTSCTFK
jgi:prepilin-type N-terminal cleavage/methylation domain-containing protein